MKKIVKVKLVRTKQGGGTHYTYPAAYDAKKIAVLCYESMQPGGHADVLARGDVDEYMLGVVDEADLAAFTISPFIVEITEAEAIALGNNWAPPVQQKITDSNKVMLVLSKQARGEELTAEDLATIDPTSPTSGIVMTPSFTVTLQEYLNK